jgi:hypothetical protein
MREKLREKFDLMVKTGIIAPVTEPTDWVSALVVTTKKSTGDLWIFIDPGDLNKAIRRPHYPMRTIEQVATTMPNAKYFTVIDLSQAFYQIPRNRPISPRSGLRLVDSGICVCQWE